MKCRNNLAQRWSNCRMNVQPAGHRNTSGSRVSCLISVQGNQNTISMSNYDVNDYGDVNFYKQMAPTLLFVKY